MTYFYERVQILSAMLQTKMNLPIPDGRQRSTTWQKWTEKKYLVSHGIFKILSNSYLK